MYTYLFSVYIWFGLTYVMYLLSNIKIARNIISSIHATSVIMFYMSGFMPMYLFYITVGYYIADSIIELYLFARTYRLYNLTILIHHIMSCLITYKLTDQLDLVGAQYLLEAFAILELSNYPIYLVYHLKIIGYDNDFVIKLLTMGEIISFMILRIYICGGKLFEAYTLKLFPQFLILISGLIYAMSIFWLYGMCVQLVKKKIEK